MATRENVTKFMLRTYTYYALLHILPDKQPHGVECQSLCRSEVTGKNKQLIGSRQRQCLQQRKP